VGGSVNDQGTLKNSRVCIGKMAHESEYKSRRMRGGGKLGSFRGSRQATNGGKGHCEFGLGMTIEVHHSGWGVPLVYQTPQFNRESFL